MASETCHEQTDPGIKVVVFFLHRATDRQRSQLVEKAEAQRRLYNMSTYSTKADAQNDAKSSLIQQSNNSLPKKFKSKEKRKIELVS